MSQGKTELGDVVDVHSWLVTLKWASAVFKVADNSISSWKVCPEDPKEIGFSRPVVYDVRKLVDHKLDQKETEIKRLKVKVANLEEVDGDAKERLLTLQGDRQEILNKKLQSELLDKRIVEEVVLKMILELKQSILAIPSRISSKMAGADTRVAAYDILVKEMNQLVSVMQEFNIDSCHDDISYMDAIEDEAKEQPIDAVLKEGEQHPDAPVRKRGRPKGSGKKK